MSFIKDLMAWKSRPERKARDEADPHAEEAREDLVAEWQAEAWDDGWQEGPDGVLDDPQESALRAALERSGDEDTAAGTGTPQGSGLGRQSMADPAGTDVDALIARLSQRGHRPDAAVQPAAPADQPAAQPLAAAEEMPPRLKISTRPLAHRPIDDPRHGPEPASGADFAPARPITEMRSGPRLHAPGQTASPPDRLGSQQEAPQVVQPELRPEARSESRPESRLESPPGNWAGYRHDIQPAHPHPQPADRATPAEDPAQRHVRPAVSAAAPAPAPDPAEQRPAGRAKTRLLGFQSPATALADPFDRPLAGAASGPARFPTGWLIVIEGPGRGASFTLGNGVSQIGRGPDQTVRLDFGDQAISRQGHAAIAYDDEVGTFYLGHGGKMNLVRLNERPLLTTEEIFSGDRIRIGETVMQFIAFCGPEFSWTESAQEDGDDAGADAARG